MIGGEHAAVVAQQNPRATQQHLIGARFAVCDAPAVAALAGSFDLAAAVEADAEHVAVVGGDDDDSPGVCGVPQQPRQHIEVFEAVFGGEGAAAQLVVDGVDHRGDNSGPVLAEGISDRGGQALSDAAAEVGPLMPQHRAGTVEFGDLGVFGQFTGLIGGGAGAQGAGEQ